MKVNRNSLGKIVLLATSLIVSLALCEIILRVWFHRSQASNYCFWPPGLSVVFKPTSDLMPGISGDSRFQTNSLGIRGDEFHAEQVHRILAVGASTTQCGYLDQTETWTHLLQEALARKMDKAKVWVGNGGVSGLTSRHHLVALKTLPLRDWKIGTVLVLTGGNDFTRRLSRDKDYDPNYLSRPEATRELLAETFTGSYVEYVEDPFLKRTALWQFLRKSKRLFSRDYFEDDRGTIYAKWRQNRQRAAEFRDLLPDLSSGLEEYARNLNQMIDAAQNQSTRIVLLTQPTIWKPKLSPDLEALCWLGGIGDFQREAGKPYYSAAALSQGMQSYNDTLLRVCRERNITCLDLASRLEKDTSVFYDDLHFNESGARKVAEAISGLLLQSPPFQDPQPAR